MKATLGMPDEELQVGGDEATPRCRSLHPDRRRRARARAIFQERIRLFNGGEPGERAVRTDRAAARDLLFLRPDGARARGGPALAAAAQSAALARAARARARRRGPPRARAGSVYDFAHIGNFRAFLTYDLLKRWLQYCGFDVDHVCNLTDVDDKIIARAARATAARARRSRPSSRRSSSPTSNALNCRPARAYP